MLNILSAALLAAPPPAPPQPLPTAGPWTVDYGLSSCVASRAYADGARTLTLALRPSPIAGTMQIILLRDGRSSTPANQHGATMGDASGTTVALSQLDYAVPSKPPKLVSLLTLTKPSSLASAARTSGAFAAKSAIHSASRCANSKE